MRSRYFCGRYLTLSGKCIETSASSSLCSGSPSYQFNVPSKFFAHPPLRNLSVFKKENNSSGFWPNEHFVDWLWLLPSNPIISVTALFPLPLLPMIATSSLPSKIVSLQNHVPCCSGLYPS